MSSSSSIFCNYILLIFVALPSVLLSYTVCNGCYGRSSSDEIINGFDPKNVIGKLLLDFSCDVGLNSPLQFIGILLFYNIIVFHIYGLLQNSFWLIDAYWSIIPLLIAIFYYNHPYATVTTFTRVCLGYLCMWSIRLTFNYLRRERYQLGAEDWRYHELKQGWLSKIWWYGGAFVTVHISQYILLFGLSLPIYYIFFPLNNDWKYATSSFSLPLNAYLGLFIAVSGNVMAFIADESLYYFVQNSKLKNDKNVRILQTGIWRYSRHPNHFGEVCWWIGLGLIGSTTGHPMHFSLIGATLNFVSMFPVLNMIERRMMRDVRRCDAYRQYQQSTSMIIPFPK